jgi:hypothetical protein
MPLDPGHEHVTTFNEVRALGCFERAVTTMCEFAIGQVG